MALQEDSQQPGKTALVVGGSTGNDLIVVLPWFDGSFQVLINNALVGTSRPTGRLIVYGQAGNDIILVVGSVASWLYGGDGDDLLQGGGGSNVLLGGAGDDILNGGQGRNLLIGGTGEDRIVGNPGDDILIGGTTAWDAQESALWALMKEWTSAADYDTRVARLRGERSDGLNGGFVLNADTVFNDLAADKLTGSSGRDWFFAHANDKVTGRHKDEEVN
jgi:Ca2+-binding RTX toxin-like protein